VGFPFGSISIYDGTRLAQPDEVWNYKTGDGIEKAILLANIWLARRSLSEGGKKRHPEEEIELVIQPDCAELRLGEHTVNFASSKGLKTSFEL
jgi:hypothetical protein